MGAKFCHAGEVQNLGRLRTEEEAARAYDFAAYQALGREANLNFGTPSKEPPAPLRKRSARRAIVSKHRGVSRDGHDAFAARLQVGHRIHDLGRWPTERDAAIAHDRAVLHFDLDDDLNIPSTSCRLGPLSPQHLQRDSRRALQQQKGTPRYIGLHEDTKRKRWSAYVKDARGRAIFAGEFYEPELAAIAYDRVALHLHGPDVVRNFPERPLSPATAKAMREYARELFKQRTSSKYRGLIGVQGGKWQVQIVAQGVRHYLGAFDVEEDAAEAYDRAAKRLHGKKAKLNFPD